MKEREDVCAWIEEHAYEYAKKAAPAYKNLKWNWGGINRKIPSAQDICNNILGMLELFREGNNHGAVLCGGVEINMKEPFIRFDKRIEAFLCNPDQIV